MSAKHIAKPWVCIVLVILTDRVAAAYSKTYEAFFPFNGELIPKILTGTCRGDDCVAGVDCSAQWAAFRATTTHSDAEESCKVVFDCIATGLLPRYTSNFQSAQVFLGLVPTLLSLIAPSIGEIALLSTKRKLLTFILAFTNPVIYIPRMLAYTDPLKSLERTEPLAAVPSILLGLDGWTATIASMLQFLLAIAAAANVLEQIVAMGYRSVIIWACSDSWLPLAWGTFPLFIHICSVAGWHMTHAMQGVREARRRRQQQRNSGGALVGFFREQIRLSSQGVRLGLVDQARNLDKDRFETYAENSGAVALHQVAAFAVFLNLIFGTFVLSSLSFVNTRSAIYIVLRFLASALVCRFLVTWELEGLRVAEQLPRSKERQKEDEVEMHLVPYRT